MEKQLIDRFNRVHNNMRISVTDQCNFRCIYCMPADGIQFLDNDKILTFDEILRVVRVAVGLGITRIRLTGGEPLVRRGLPDLIKGLRQIEGLQDISMTTNGILLKEQAGDLYRAGLQRINVSLDSLDPEKFHHITRRNVLKKVLEGLEELGKYPLRPIKINAVAMRGLTDNEILDFANMAREKGYQMRFIEFMPLEADNIWSRDKIIPGSEILEKINAVWKLVPMEDSGKSEPAVTYRFEDGSPGEIGVITPVTNPFCSSCDRIRLTADGQIRNCLFSLQEIDLRTPLRNGGSDAEIEALLIDAVARKEAGHRINYSDFQRPARIMHAIGG